MMKKLKKVKIYTDGACSVNPGEGGWAAILLYKGAEKKVSGAEAQTTNNRMELTAIIEGLKALKEKCVVTVYSDSTYATDAFLKGWIYNWEAKDWKKGSNDIKNTDLWLELLGLTRTHSVDFVWVKGHSDNHYNNLCDALARKEIKKLRAKQNS